MKTREYFHRTSVALVLILATAVVPMYGMTADPGGGQGADHSGRFKVFVEESGVYSVTYDNLVQVGLKPGAIPSENIGMTSQGARVPIWIEDGGDGRFGKGDRILFVAKRMQGEYSFLDEYSRFNCYILDFRSTDPLNGNDVAGAPGGDAVETAADLSVRSRFEEDTVMVRYPERPGEAQERWYWSRLSVTDREPWRLSLTFDGIRREHSSKPKGALDLRNLTTVGEAGEITKEHLAEIFGPRESVTRRLTLRMGLRGWSKPYVSGGLADHHVSIKANGRELPPAVWNGTDQFTHQFEVELHGAETTRLDLEVFVPKRVTPEEGDLLVDVVMLNWIEADFPREPSFHGGQSRFEVESPDSQKNAWIDVVAEDQGWLYGSGAGRVEIAEGPNHVEIDRVGEGPFFSVVGNAYREADHIVTDHPSALKTVHRQTDYIMIAHRRLIEAVQPLAEFHRANGLSVEVVDVEDIFDEFNHGIQHPRSLHDFVQWAYDHWEKPRPRFVLLAGDASWDHKNLTADDSRYADWTYRPGEARRFIKNQSSSYENLADVNHRNLVPTWGYQSSQGHAASDNWLACVDGDDIFPDVAVGRIPVTEPEEMAAVVRKTIAYAKRGPAGPWREKLLFITNESKGFQRASDRTAGAFEERGYNALKIYPRAEEKANEQHTRDMVSAFDQGLLMVQFLGHGGRYIWRTGPPDLLKNHDLFTLEHLDTLAPTEKLPFVISLTCYSAPFDHPTADSIGEKLLRIEGKGAIGVFAASWRNTPSPNMGRIVMDELTTPGSTIGEALMRAKRRIRSETLVETYNLLGDPAISLNLSPNVEAPDPEFQKKPHVKSTKKGEPTAAKGTPTDQNGTAQGRIKAD